MYSVTMPDKGVIHILGGIEREGARFQIDTQNGTKFKLYEMFISVIFHL